MKLPGEFFRLPVRVDAGRLREEVAALPAAAWHAHPTDFGGNSSVRLVSVEGREDDGVRGPMRPTAHLQACPYLQQVLAGFGVVWSRSRLMKLAPRSTVPEHADINHHWFTRVRVHIPLVTRPEVLFHCGARSVHMAAGEVWIFDNWRRHRVENPTDEERIHLVADTSGSAAFWKLVADGLDPQAHAQWLPYVPGKVVTLLTEQGHADAVMPPSEVEVLVEDLRAELDLPPDAPGAREQLARFRVLLDSFCRDWRQLWALYGNTEAGWPQFAALRDGVRAQAQAAAGAIVARTNQVPVMKVLEGRVLRPAMDLPPDATAPASHAPAGRAMANRVDRPLIIVSAPRSGSTLLFETLACTPQLWTLGGEAHQLVEGIPELRPGAPGVDSNRLTERDLSGPVARRIRAELLDGLRRADGARPGGGEALRVLEKTPKNALRIPFFNALFPDARFLFLWRDPRENLASIVEAWRDGGWVTYPRLDGWDGPWSLLLPPGWRELRGRPPEAVAAFQWEAANRTILSDLRGLPPERWMALRYQDVVERPAQTVARICEFGGLDFDAALRQRCGAPLPPSRYTLTAPAPDKWRRHEAAISRVLPSVSPTWEALQGLHSAKR